MRVSPDIFSSFQMKIHTSLITDNFASPEKFVNPTSEQSSKKVVFGVFLLLNLKHQHQLQMRI